MNKHRMREPFHTLIWKASIGYNDSWSQVDPEVLEKFGELIVKQCIYLVENLPSGYKDYRNQIEDSFRTDCVEKIEQYFGVEK